MEMRWPKALGNVIGVRMVYRVPDVHWRKNNQAFIAEKLQP